MLRRWLVPMAEGASISIGLKSLGNLLQRFFEVGYLCDDVTAALANEILDLKIDHRTFIVCRKAEVASVAENRLRLRERVADFGGAAAIDVRAVEHDEYGVARSMAARLLPPSPR